MLPVRLKFQSSLQILSAVLRPLALVRIEKFPVGAGKRANCLLDACGKVCFRRFNELTLRCGKASASVDK